MPSTVWSGPTASMVQGVQVSDYFVFRPETQGLMQKFFGQSCLNLLKLKIKLNQKIQIEVRMITAFAWNIKISFHCDLFWPAFHTKLVCKCYPIIVLFGRGLVNHGRPKWPWTIDFSRSFDLKCKFKLACAWQYIVVTGFGELDYFCIGFWFSGLITNICAKPT